MASKAITPEPKQNVTLSLPKDVLRRAKVLAVERGVSLSKLFADSLLSIARSDDSYDRAYRAWKSDIKKKHHGGGSTAKSREELHDRR